MATPLAEYWKTVGAGGAWRKASSDPPPAPPTEVEWLERKAGMADWDYIRKVEMGALPTFTGAQLP